MDNPLYSGHRLENPVAVWVNGARLLDCKLHEQFTASETRFSVALLNPEPDIGHFKRFGAVDTTPCSSRARFHGMAFADYLSEIAVVTPTMTRRPQATRRPLSVDALNLTAGRAQSWPPSFD